MVSKSPLGRCTLIALLLGTTVHKATASEILPGSTLALAIPRSSGDTFRIEPAGADGGIVAAWIDGDAVVARRFSAELEPIGNEQRLSGPRDRPTDFQLCGRRDGSYAAAWKRSAVLDHLSPHEYSNLADVRVVNVDDSGVPTAAWRANAERAGSQRPAFLRCLDGGGTAVLWWSSCDGVRTFADAPSESFVPARCAGVISSTLQWRSFASDGTPTSRARSSVAWWDPRENVLPLPSGGVLVFIDTFLAHVDRNGRLEATGSAPQVPDIFIEGDCNAGDHACVLVNHPRSLEQEANFKALVFDPVLRTVSDRVTIKPWRYCSSRFGSCLVFSRDGAIACDRQGQCLAIWVQLRTVIDVHDARGRIVGLFGRSFDAHSRELGAPTKLMEIEAGRERPTVLSTSDGMFVIAVPYSSRVELRTFRFAD